MVAVSLSCPLVCRILVSRPGIKPTFPALEDRFLTTGLPGSSQAFYTNGALWFLWSQCCYHDSHFTPDEPETQGSPAFPKVSHQLSNKTSLGVCLQSPSFIYSSSLVREEAKGTDDTFWLYMDCVPSIKLTANLPLISTSSSQMRKWRPREIR